MRDDARVVVAQCLRLRLSLAGSRQQKQQVLSQRLRVRD